MNFKTVLTGFLSASALLGAISLSTVDFDVNSRNATSSGTTHDFPLLTFSQHDNDFTVRNGTRSSENPDIRLGTRDSRLST
ncbi:hypothetical protein [Bacillus safensis]|uniref:hypothetical protein n=1 Tax=Bacillus safensis TaxID=561879 RepID=UPI000DAD36B5|nr:hypothetical protein [Bacillus safensis]